MHTTSLSTTSFEGKVVANPTDIFKRNHYLKTFSVLHYLTVLSKKATGTHKASKCKNLCVLSNELAQFCALDIGYLVNRMALGCAVSSKGVFQLESTYFSAGQDYLPMCNS